jgi:hypothetical protein
VASPPIQATDWNSMACCQCCCAQYDGVCCGTGEEKVCCKTPRECCTVYQVGVGESDVCCTETQYCCNDGQGVCCEVGEICCVGEQTGAVCCPSEVVCCAGVCCAEGECCVNDQCTACESCSSVLVGSTLSLDCDCYVRASVDWLCDEDEIPDGWAIDPEFAGSPPRVITPWALTDKVCLPGNTAYDASVAAAQAAVNGLLASGCAAVGGVQTKLRHCCDGYCQDGPCEAPP